MVKPITTSAIPALLASPFAPSTKKSADVINSARAMIIKRIRIPILVQSFFAVIVPKIASVTKRANEIRRAFH